MDRIATIGFFDGIHRGHVFLFEHMCRLARERGLASLIVTFYEHPRSVLQADYVPQLLTTVEERKALLSNFGEVVMLSFEGIKKLTAAEFMHYMKETFHVSVLLMGYDHRFGSDRLKHPQEYIALGAQQGIEVLTMGEFIDGEWHVSSTEIRQALENGNIFVANELLGRPYDLGGKVVHGNGIGRKLGFPTANIQPECAEKIIPKSGVYAVYVRPEGKEWLPAMLNIGTNPTVGNSNQTIEVHIPSFRGNLYGQHLDIRFMRFIRDEKRFESLSALQEQIATDVGNSLRQDS